MITNSIKYIRRIIVIILSIGLIVAVFNQNTDIVHLIIGIWIIGLTILVATTPVYRVMQAIGLVIVVGLTSTVAFELTMIWMQQNCLLSVCDEVDKEAQAIEKYAQFIQEIYPDEPWVKDYSYEVATILRRDDRRQYFPYIGSREAPYEGVYASVDRNGLRPVPQSQCQEDSYDVIAMGSSTMWGQYDPDDQTLAALIQEELDEFIDQPVCLKNYGQGTWNQTQSLIQLINLIQAGDIPDLVIFYDGAVDVVGVESYNQANIPLASRDTAKLFGTVDYGLTSSEQLENWIRSLETVQLVSKFLDIENKQLQPSTSYSRPRYVEAWHYEREEAMDDLVDLFATNHQIIDLLSVQYDFDYLIIIQPVSFYGEKQLTSKEQYDVTDGWPGYQHYAIYQYVYPALEQLANLNEGIYFLGNLLDDITEEIYGDPLHPLPKGNRIIAAEIGSIAEQALLFE